MLQFLKKMSVINTTMEKYSKTQKHRHCIPLTPLNSLGQSFKMPITP